MARYDAPRHSVSPLELRVLDGTYAICRLPAGANIMWAKGEFLVVTRSAAELMPTTVMCDESYMPPTVECDRGWRVIRFVGTFSFGEVGVLASVVDALAEARVPVVSVSTFETDYVLVKAERFDRVQQVLEEAGHRFIDSEDARSTA